MSTRSVTQFVDYGDEITATVYRHTDGYPEGAGADLSRFLEDVRTQTSDTRFDDGSYLAAKYVVWLAAQFARDPDKPLDFLSVGILREPPGDHEYVYRINCSNIGADGLPEITAETAGGEPVDIP